MNQSAYRFEFIATVPMLDAEQTLHLALFSAEGLFGSARVRLEAGYRVDEASRTVTVGAATEVGAAVVKVYTGLLLREFGENAFQVRPTPAAPRPESVECAA
ncbi:MAG: hypothetical protein HOP29_14245 [Phycisphaerales bacterium]|nr:hypothetical protein [Phycisphaerales bacterium]